MTRTVDDDEDIDWDDWIALSDGQQDAILAREMAEHVKWFNALTPLQQYRSRRRRSLETCAGWRRHRPDIPQRLGGATTRSTMQPARASRLDLRMGDVWKSGQAARTKQCPTPIQMTQLTPER